VLEPDLGEVREAAAKPRHLPPAKTPPDIVRYYSREIGASPRGGDPGKIRARRPRARPGETRRKRSASSWRRKSWTGPARSRRPASSPN